MKAYHNAVEREALPLVVLLKEILNPVGRLVIPGHTLKERAEETLKELGWDDE